MASIDHNSHQRRVVIAEVLQAAIVSPALRMMPDRA
jgi:hypothetical protein